VKHTTYYAYNGRHAEQAGTKEVCQQYIKDSGRSDLYLCTYSETSHRYRPVLDVKVK
jgi:hypothetical protein